MKILFMTPGTNFVYGATKSMSNIIRNIDAECDLIIPPIGRFPQITESEVRKTLDYKIGKLFRCFLPFRRCFMGSENPSFLRRLYWPFVNIMAWLSIRKIKRIIKQGNYDVVYLNSMVLFPLIKRIECRVVIHIREIFSGNDSYHQKVRDEISKADGIIFIDKSTERSFHNEFPNSVVMNNPFDMTSAMNIDKKEVEKEYALDFTNKVVFSYMGMLLDVKGIQFLVESFLSFDCDNAILLVCGRVEGRVANKCVNIAKNDKRVIFLGEIESIEKIYAVSDCILRGEPSFAIGRTVYEGLFAGCNVIIPGNTEENLKEMFDYNDFKNNIFFYSPSNMHALHDAMSEIIPVKKNERVFRENISDYIGALTTYLNKRVIK